MAQTSVRSWWTDVEHLREGYEQRRLESNGSGRRFDRIRERPDGRFSLGQGQSASAVATATADLTPLDDASLAPGLVASWEPSTESEPVARDIVLTRDRPPRRPRRDHVLAAADRDPTGPRDVEVAELRGGRRTVEIRGRTVASPAVTIDHEAEIVPTFHRREAGGVIEVFGQRPDRLALWALLLGIVLILVAMSSGDASAAVL